MDDFMKNVAAKVWPKGRRSVFCFTYRDETESCKAKEGNPYGPYWNKFKINFDKDIKFAPLSYDMANEEIRDEWLKTYPKEKYPVLAFTSNNTSKEFLLISWFNLLNIYSLRFTR